MCDDLVGNYPKQFHFTGFHVNCLCVATSILASKEEIDKMTDIILDGGSTENFKSNQEIKKVPTQFNEWISDNKERLLRAKSQPYFIQYNFKEGNITKGLQLAGLKISK